MKITIDSVLLVVLVAGSWGGFFALRGLGVAPVWSAVWCLPFGLLCALCFLLVFHQLARRNGSR